MLFNQLSIKHIIRKPINNQLDPPLFLIIHGYGSNENDILNSIIQQLPNYFFIVSIQGIYTIGHNQYSWYNINFHKNLTTHKIQIKNYSLLQASQAINKINIFIDEAINEYKLNNNQVWICGFSQGAIISYAIALKNPYKVKRVMALSGYFDETIYSFKKQNNQKLYSKLSMFISHGKYDDIIPIKWVKKGLYILQKEYLINSFSYKEYESGHWISQSNHNDLIYWIKQNHLNKLMNE
ncbi:alpha/beta hydrolase [Blattabacterium cuenoti]|uniref:alpha/beta hydrolase n=1 Tax=Blattabacterium cuenoti TaxID=1653831 RepID=UPI00163B90D2|nr:alpha/beta hydrolase-fold protein [Blattabacterium cuenoti]